jgi:hypothetical protein
VDSGKLKIVKAKNWKNSGDNPNGKEYHFRLVSGCRFIDGVPRGWHMPMESK